MFPADFQAGWQGLRKKAEGRLTVDSLATASCWPQGEQAWEVTGCFHALAHFAGKDSEVRETDRSELAQADSSLGQSGVNSGTGTDG